MLIRQYSPTSFPFYSVMYSMLKSLKSICSCGNASVTCNIKVLLFVDTVKLQLSIRGQDQSSNGYENRWIIKQVLKQLHTA